MAVAKGDLILLLPYQDTQQRTTDELFEEIKARKIPNIEMNILSMGMSHDYQVAVEEGANMVRVGRSMFA